MSSVVVPFYQRRHKHFDQSYRNIQTRYVLEEYAARKAASRQAAYYESPGLGKTTCRLCARRARTLAHEAMQESRKRTHEEKTHASEEKRIRFASELSALEKEIHTARHRAREHLDRLAIQRMVEENMALERHAVEESISRAPEILVRLRSHTVWEKMSVSLCFTVQGFPTPIVQWYKNEELITPASDPTKYRIESKYGVHVLHINRKHDASPQHLFRDICLSQICNSSFKGKSLPPTSVQTSEVLSMRKDISSFWTHLILGTL